LLTTIAPKATIILQRKLPSEGTRLESNSQQRLTFVNFANFTALPPISVNTKERGVTCFV
jgi:hypothetical protein